MNRNVRCYKCKQSLDNNQHFNFYCFACLNIYCFDCIKYKRTNNDIICETCINKINDSEWFIPKENKNI